MLREAMLWEVVAGDDRRVRCDLCPHRCVILPGRRGVCGVRENREGALYTLVYGRTIAQHDDPIEKKPLFHFLPGSRAFSIAAPGCNLRCTFCQNWEISQMPRDLRAVLGDPASPATIARLAEETGCASVAYTYTEPTVFAEYALDTAREAQARGLKNVFVTNGFMSPELVGRLGGLIDAANVDLKAGRNAFYRKQCGAALEPILESLKLMRQAGIWLEVTTLIIPDLNDSDEELGWVAHFLCDELGPDVPWHLSRFHPDYRMQERCVTPVETMERACQIGRGAGMHYVYVGNLPGHRSESTFCPDCGNLVIGRIGYHVHTAGLQAGACSACGTRIAGVGM